MEEKIRPLVIRFKDGDTYELDFNRESVSFAENRGFDPDEVTKFPTTKIPEFFYYAFRMNHKKLAKNQTDAILTKLGGLTPKMTERLILLYNQAIMSNQVFQDDEDLEKNAEATVEMD